MKTKPINFGVSTTLCFALLLFATTVGAKNDLNLEDYKGRVVYLDFWASWCIPCEKSFPFMNRLKAQFEDQGLTVIAVSVDSSREKAEQFLVRHPADFKILWDGDGALSEHYQLQGLPNSFLFDRDGTLVGSHLGFKKQDEKALSSEIQSLLEK